MNNKTMLNEKISYVNADFYLNEAINNMSYGGLMHKSNKYPEPKTISFNQNSTTVSWNDGTKTTVRLMNGDKQDKYSAFTSALAKKIYGNNSKIKSIIETKDENFQKQKERELFEEEELEKQRIAHKREKRAIKKRAKEIIREQKAQELAKKMLENL